ncbi:MAG TPA: hypothetical protein VLF43_03050 [Candidatus Saccharimonadales bacterium]|nr:hypothetical protein [Candidatus Saccharimonadales bacterium]
MRQLSSSQLYVDVRLFDKPDTLSYDLSQHLPRRLTVGPVLVLANNPPVFLSVIRKRLAKLLYALECERARTLDRQKRLALNHEVLRLNNACFTSKPSIAVPDVLCTTPHALATIHLYWQTIYITTSITDQQLQTALSLLHSGGLLVVYGHLTAAQEAVLAAHQMV